MNFAFFDLESVVLDTGIVEYLIEDIQQDFAGSPDGLNIPPRFAFQLRAFEQDLRKPDDRIERCSDFMADRCQKTRFRPVASLRTAKGVFKLRGNSGRLFAHLPRIGYLPAQQQQQRKHRYHKRNNHTFGEV